MSAPKQGRPRGAVVRQRDLPKATVEAIVRGIESDILDRSGLGDELTGIDEFTRGQIRDSWRMIIVRAVAGTGKKSEDES